MNILVINCGSSSLKYQLIDMDGEEVVAKGLVERIGLEGSLIEHNTEGKEGVTLKEDMKDHTRALELVLEVIADEEHGAVESLDEIDAVGHRVVHGGEKFSGSVLIDNEVMEVIEECVDIAPLHNPPNILGIEACRDLMPETPMVAVFDTAFHQTMPAENYLYALPYEYYEKHAIRRYGFHGTSHKYVTERTAEFLDEKQEDLNIITCHLGNGSSITAVKNGKSYLTSMGLTPLEGVVMGTRSGNIDPAIIPFLMDAEDLTIDEVNDILNKESGVFGISGVSSDFRDIEDAAAEGHEKAQLALDIFCNKVREYIGSYAAAMGGVDAIVFTAGIGENSGLLRAQICEGLEFMGVEIDQEANDIRGKAAIVSTDKSDVKVLVIPTDEEVMIARETLNLVK